MSRRLRSAIASLVLVFAVEAVAAPPAAPLVETPGEALSLSEVLAAVQRHDPRLQAASYEVDQAQGRVLSARGGFDTVVSLENLAQPPYGSTLTRLRVDQATPLYGLTAWMGYQIGTTGPRGVVPATCTVPGSFDFSGCGRLITATGGEVFAGFTLPLLRGGWTDRRRTDIEQSKLERARTSHARDATQLVLELDAATAYWRWVSAGMTVKIEQRLLELAVARANKLQRQIDLGALDRMVGLDNQRVILDRQARLVMAERDFQGSALALSLYLRDAHGEPIVAGVERLPLGLPAMRPPANDDVDADIAQALDRRPDRHMQQRRLEQSTVELRWAKNQRAPRLDISAQINHEFGANPNTDPGEPIPLRTNMFTWVNLEVPIPFRFGRGQVRSAESSLRIMAADLQLLDNQIAVEVADAHVAVKAAYQQAILAGGQVGLTHELARAELARFELGDGDLLLVNLRELAIADAASAEVTAVVDFFIARARLEVAMGEGVQDVRP